MKKLLLASAVVAVSVASAHAAPQVYGKAFVTLDAQDGNDAAKAKNLDARSKLNSTGSRIGFKGSEKLTANTDLVYQLEYRIDVDADKGNNFKSRDTYLGLSHKTYGTAVAGRLTAIDDYINYANVTKGGVVGGDRVLAGGTLLDGPRANNAIAYFSPTYNNIPYLNGVQFMGMYVLDETSNSTPIKDKDDKIIGYDHGTDTLGRDAFGVGVKIEPNNAPYKAGLTYLQAGDVKAIRASGAYAFSPVLTLAGLYQNSQFAKGGEKENALAISGKYKIAQTPWVAYSQIDLVDNASGIKDAEKQRLAVGGEYNFNKNTTGHVYGAYLQDKATGTATAKSYGVGAGIEYKF